MLIIVSVFLITSQLSAQNILCVDRAFGDTTADPFTDPWPWFQESLDATGYTYEYWKVEEPENNGPDATYMSNFDVVIWYTGEAWSDSYTMTIDDEFNLLLFQTLNGGGLFLSAQDYLWDRYPTYGTFTPGEFPYDQLGVVSVFQDAINVSEQDTARFNGAEGSIYEGMSILVQDIYSGIITDEGLWVDSIYEHNGLPIMTSVHPWVSECNPGVQYEGESFRTIFSTVSFAAIVDLEVRNEFLIRTVNYLTNSVGTSEKNIEQSSIMVSPNPARDYVNIGMLDKMKELRLINAQGQVVYHQDVNNIKTRIDLSQLPTGIYIVQALTANGQAVSKMMVE